MKLNKWLAAWLLLLCGWAGREASAEPLSLVPEEADFVITVARPKELVARGWDFVHSEFVRRLPGYEEALDQLTIRRLVQLVRYAERELGKPWRELVDELLGGGVVLAGKYGPVPSPVLLVIQGRNAPLMRQASELLADVLEQELARRDQPHQRKEHERSGLKVRQLGDMYWTLHGPALLVSNRLEVFDYVAPLTHGRTERSFAQSGKWRSARTIVPSEALAWAWFDLRPPKTLKEVQQLLEVPGDLAIVHIFFGRYLDIFKRSDFLTAWLTANGVDFTVSVYAPAGWQGSGIGARTQVPEDGKAGLRPPLQVPGMVYSSSFYFDLGAFIKHRDKFLTEQQRKGFEDFDRNSAKFLLGTRFSELASGLGPRHRLLVAQPDRKTYSVPTGITLPSFALVLELKDAERMGNKLATLLRGAAFLATFQTRMDLVEEEYHGVKLVGYRFVDNEANRAIQNGLLFNFSPCFAQVGDQFLLGSSLELGRQLVVRLQQEQRQPRARDPILFMDVVSWAGIADLLEQNKEQLVVQYMLERVQTPESARQQADEVIRWLRHLEHLQFQFTSEPKSSRLEIHMKLSR